MSERLPLPDLHLPTPGERIAELLRQEFEKLMAPEPVKKDD